ncbi:MAG: response regulator [Paracoccaceae bacterium]|nr:response regulator [Paracoccaceae bacterium]
MTQKRILIVDDDSKMRRLLRRCLEAEGFGVVEAETEAEVSAALAGGEISLVTLDVSLGGESGLVIARNLRQRSGIPIIMVSARSDVIDRVVGLELGADDYITKPFHVRELAARVRAQLRRAEAQAAAGPRPACAAGTTEERLEFDGMVVEPGTLETWDRDGVPVPLTTGDTELLMVFLRHPKRALTRDRIMTLLGGAEWSPLDRTIDNKVARLRKKIERDPEAPQLIKTVRGVGYMFTAPVSEAGLSAKAG